MDYKELKRLTAKIDEKTGKVNFKILTKKEELNYIEKIEDGDLKAKENFIIKNIPLVIKNAKLLVRPDDDIGDLISEGIFGLYKALEKFDSTKKLKFSTYATYWIRSYIFTSQKQNGMIRLPNNIHERNIKIETAKKELYKQGKRINVSNLAIESGLKEKEIISNRAKIKKSFVYEYDLFTSSRKKNNEAPIDFASEDEPFVELVRGESIVELNKIMKQKLSIREMDIIQGLLGFDENDFSDIKTIEFFMDKYGVSFSTITRIKTQALKKLRELSVEIEGILK